MIFDVLASLFFRFGSVCKILWLFTCGVFLVLTEWTLIVWADVLSFSVRVREGQLQGQTPALALR